jgi:hypothetical protein
MPSPSFMNTYLTMKADESTDCAGRWGGRLSTGLCFFFILGPLNRKIDIKKLGFRLGSDLAMLSTTVRRPARIPAGQLVISGCWFWVETRWFSDEFKSSQVNTLPKAKSQAKDKRAKDRQNYAALRWKVGVAPPGFEFRRGMRRVAFPVFPAGRAGDTRAAICTIPCFVSIFRVCVCVCSFCVGALERRKRVSTQSPVPFFSGSYELLVRIRHITWY